MWSNQQEEALKDIKNWLNDDTQQVYRLFGFAGSGKTFLCKEIASNVKSVLYGAYTGKAASVMRSKGCEGAQTIHSMIYKLFDDEDVDDAALEKQPRFVLNKSSPVRNVDLIIIDECSMVDEIIGKDLLSFGTKVLVLGDPAQLPPVQGFGYFTSQQPNYMLTEVHRQAWDNPIIAMSMAVRQGLDLEYGSYGESQIIPYETLTDDMLINANQILVGLNQTRKTYNSYMRNLMGRNTFYPQAGDKLVCLRNDNRVGLFNGSIWNTVNSVHKKQSIQLKIENEEGIKNVKVREEFFNGTENIPWGIKKKSQEFDYGYALTCHKSQGSQWDNVLIFDESSAFRDDKIKWLYTALTRSAKKLTLIK